MPGAAEVVAGSEGDAGDAPDGAVVIHAEAGGAGPARAGLGLESDVACEGRAVAGHDGEAPLAPASEASDLYALGVVAYEVFTGRKPFDHDQLLPLLQMHLGATPVPPSRHRPGIAPELDAIILKLLNKRPADRYPTARALAEALRSVRESAEA